MHTVHIEALRYTPEAQAKLLFSMGSLSSHCSSNGQSKLRIGVLATLLADKLQT